MAPLTPKLVLKSVRATGKLVGRIRDVVVGAEVDVEIGGEKTWRFVDGVEMTGSDLESCGFPYPFCMLWRSRIIAPVVSSYIKSFATFYMAFCISR